MPPTDRFVISFAAEPPQDALPYGRWADTLRQHFLDACAGIDSDDEQIGTPGEIKWFPDRTFAGRTYVPAVARTSEGYELFGFVSFAEGGEGGTAPSDFVAYADFTNELAETNPDWKLDLNDEVIGTWRGEQGKTAEMTLVWGVPMIPGGVLVTAELANLAVDQCEIIDERFTLIAPDNYRGDFLDVKLWDKRGGELAAESLYADEDDEDEEEEEEE
ncbi:MAG: hypothetical protein ACLP0J_02015 [Solirubrobacteraceae bacterium]